MHESFLSKPVRLMAASGTKILFWSDLCAMVLQWWVLFAFGIIVVYCVLKCLGSLSLSAGQQGSKQSLSLPIFIVKVINEPLFCVLVVKFKID